MAPECQLVAYLSRMLEDYEWFPSLSPTLGRMIDSSPMKVLNEVEVIQFLQREKNHVYVLTVYHSRVFFM